MIKIEETEVVGLRHAIRGMRNPMNSWEQSDSGICKGGDDGLGCENCAIPCEHAYDHEFKVGKKDYKLMEKLRDAGTDHRKYMRMVVVYLDITAPLYWWKEFDTYKVGTVANSCSTMHKIHAKEFTLVDFSHEHLIRNWGDSEDNKSFIFTEYDVPLDPDDEESEEIKFTDADSPLNLLEYTITALNHQREAYLVTKDKKFWWQMIQLLPSSYNQKRTVMLNYEVLANIYKSRRLHKLDEWRIFCTWIESLPYRHLITGKDA
jgi:hypothetical protein